jgi:hypothetical protein
MRVSFLKSLLVLLSAIRVGYAQTDDDSTPPMDSSWTGSISDSVRHLDPTCPPPTVNQGSLCVLKKDVDLSGIGTMDVASYTHLNCLGHRIYTSVPAVDAGRRSKPEVAFHLSEAFGVKIQNCVIDGFEFPILAHDIKLPADALSDPGALERLADRIEGNTITGALLSIELVKVDNMRITGNTITQPSATTLEIAILRDSKINQIVNNTITRSGSAVVPYVQFPGPVSASNPLFSTVGGLSLIMTQGSGFPNLINFVYEGRLYQYPNAVPEFGPDGIVVNSGDFNPDNVIEGNTFTGCVGSCIGVTNGIRPNIIGNQFHNITSGGAITFGNITLTGPFPGKCSSNPNRWCLKDPDCNIPTIDSASQGTCSGVVSHSVVSITNGGVIANNTFTGPFTNAISLGTPNVLVQGNTISGPIAPGTDFTASGGVGVDIRVNAPKAVIITQNVISNLPAPIRVTNINGAPFGAQISLNDFTGYSDEAFVFSGFNLDGELSVGGQGNYWGLPCSPMGGGGFDPNKVLVMSSGKVASDGTVSVSGSVNLYAHDSHPYGVPVANTDPAMLPTTLSAGYCSATP